jgi:CheY-like chemotaxis protein
MPLPEGAQELIGATQTAARRGGLLLDKIARISGPIDMRPTPLNLRDFLDSFTPLARAPLPPEITFESDCHVANKAVLLDREPAGQPSESRPERARCHRQWKAGRITLEMRDVQDTWLDITVSDTGPGFGEEALNHALDPFFTTKGEGGSGLGLSMVYDMVQARRRSGASDQRAGGGVVTLRLPLKPAEAEARPRLVMVVDDMAELRATVRMTLTDMGHQVIEAATVGEALALSDIPGLNWVISDLRLGGRTA